MDFSFLDDYAEEEAGPQIIEAGEGYRNILIFAEVADGALCPSTLQAMGQARDLADQIGVYVYGVLLGEGMESLGEQLVAYGADRVLVADDAALTTYQPETYTQALACLVEEYRRNFGNPYHAASAGYIDDIIEPRETRPKIIAALAALRDKQTSGPPRKHGNIPM